MYRSYAKKISLLSLLCLTGCSSIGMKVSKVPQDPASINMTTKAKYQLYQKESLGFIGNTVVDGEGNTLSREGLKKFLEDKEDIEALQRISKGFGRKTFGVLAPLVLAGIYGYSAYWISGKVQNDASFDAVFPYAAAAGVCVEISFLSLWFGDRIDNQEAENIYNIHLKQKLGLAK